MEKAFIIVILLLSSIVTTALIQDFPQAQGGTNSSLLFSDHFDGNTLNTTKWNAQTTTNKSGLPGYGGSIIVNNSYVALASNGSSFPFVTSASNPFSQSGDFAVEFDIAYTRVGGWGSGFWVTNGPFEPVSRETQTPNILAVWAGTTEGVNIFFFGNVTYKLDFYWNPFGYDSTGPLNIRLDYAKGVYNLHLNGSLIATHASALRPDTIGFGHPPASWVPEPFSNNWSSFKIDSVKVLPSSQLSISSSASSGNIGYKVNINGNLTNAEKQPISGAAIILSYLIPGVVDYTPITAVTTDTQGAYSATWIPTATGTFTLRASWAGNAADAGSYDVKNVSSLQDNSTAVFLAESNSTLSSLAFNSTSNEISFTVSGSSGTTGYVRFLISKTLIANMTAVKVLVDNAPIACNVSSLQDSWQLYFTYLHSTHVVTVIMPNSSTVPEFPAWILVLLFSACAVSAFIYKKKDHQSWTRARITAAF